MSIVKTLNTQDRIIISSMVITLGGVVFGALLARPYIFGISALIVIMFLIVGWSITRDPRLVWLLLFGLVAGVMELFSDWLHVEYLNSLVYTDYFGFRLLASPSYMPIGWWLTTVQFGYLALRLSERWPQWISVALITVLGMSLPPWYEEFATPAKTWYYTTNRLMLSRTPLWVIFTYGGCMFSIATMVLLCYRTRSWGRAVLGGIFAGAGIMFSGVFWFALLG